MPKLSRLSSKLSAQKSKSSKILSESAKEKAACRQSFLFLFMNYSLIIGDESMYNNMSAKGGKSMKSGKHVSEKNNIRLLCWLLAAGIVVLALLLLSFHYRHTFSSEENSLTTTEEQLPAPDTFTPEPSPDPTPSPEPTLEPLPAGTAPEIERQSGIYTFLLAGLDEISNSTDTMMIIRFDTRQHKLDIVSIPRDTVINVDWWIERKLNTVYAASINNGGPGIDYLSMHIRWLTGFDVDYYAVVSLDAFVNVIDAIGGIWFDVPEEMRYGDYEYYDSFYIDLDPGYQLLDGYQAMGLCRYRSGYSTADLGRMDMQHAFLKAAFKQFLSIKNIPNAAKAIKLAVDGTNTNLSTSNIAWFLGQLLQCREEDISFCTAPGTACIIQDYWYYVLDLNNWLSLLNEHLNPYDSPITEDMLDLVYMRDGVYYSTGELKGPSFFGIENGTDGEEPIYILSEAEPLIPAAEKEFNEDGEY